MSSVKAKRSASMRSRNRTDAILKRVDALQKRIDRRIADIDASLKESEPIFLKMKAALHAAEKVGKRVKA